MSNVRLYADLSSYEQSLISGARVPETLGDYLILVLFVRSPDSKAARYLSDKIAEPGESKDSRVIAHPSQMLKLLASME